MSYPHFVFYEYVSSIEIWFIFNVTDIPESDI